jgi:hypothetical protein
MCMGFGLMMGFSDHFITLVVSTSNYNVIANLHTLQFATTYPQPPHSVTVAFSRFLVTASNNGDYSVSVLVSYCPANIPQF